MEESVRNIIFHYLDDHFDHIDEITLKEIRKEVEAKIDFATSTINKELYKNLIIESYEEGKMLLEGRIKGTRERNIENNMKVSSWRFTNSESKIIEDICEQYIQANSIEAAELLSFMKDFNDHSKSRSDLWKTLYAAFPHRNREAVYRRARTLLSRRLKPVWTEKDKESLMALVSHDDDDKGQLP